MAFSDIQIQAVSQAAVDAMHAETPILNLFAHSYNDELDGTFGQAVAVPTTSLSAAGLWDDTTNNLEGTNEFGGEIVNLDKRFATSMKISDKALAYTGVSFARDAGTAIGKSLARACVNYTVGLINSTNCSLSANFDATSKTAVAKLTEIAYDNDLPVKDSVVLLNPAQWAKVLGTIGDYSIFGNRDIIQLGVVTECLGFAGFAATTALPSGTIGAIVPRYALATISRYIAPVFPESFANAWKVSDENGLVFSMSEHSNTTTGYGYVSGTAAFGAKLIFPSKIVRLV